jgi:NADPH:quinone reductase-like Zn-dependent oxidoreductase
LPQPLPLTLGSDLSGEIIAVGQGVSDLRMGDQVYGVTNPRFIGAYAEYAVASAAMVSRKPTSLTYIEAASVPAIAVTAWQALFDQAKLKAGKRWSFTGQQETLELMRFSWPTARMCEPSRMQPRMISPCAQPRRKHTD